MKTSSIILFFFLLMGCGPDGSCDCNKKEVKDAKWIINMHLVDGSFKVDTFQLPSTSLFWIQGGNQDQYGTYSLKYMPNPEGEHRVLKAAVIDFEVVGKIQLDTAAKEVHINTPVDTSKAVPKK